MVTTSLRVLRVLFGALGVSAIVTEIVTLLQWGVFNGATFFSYFTILSNIAAAVLLITYGFLHQYVRNSVQFQIIRGAVTLYMAMTGVIFAVLLANIPNAQLTAVPWDNIVLHYIMPVVLVADWLISPPKVFIKLKYVFLWVLFPVAYIVYSLVRGAFVQWYPYPFLNPTVTSYTTVFLTLAILSIGVLLGAWVLIWYARRVGHPVVYKHSAGGVVLKNGKVLLIHWDPPRSSYDFPKGSLDKGESSKEACVREVYEETGYETRIITSLGHTAYEYAWKDGTYIKKKVDYYLLELAGSADNPTPRRERHETFANAWCTYSEAKSIITRDIDKEILEKALAFSQ